ncbi:lysis protein for colicin E6 [Salmonella enterica]|uniref:Lysis protein for colicin n=1 Tax=Salmonella enterica subsp. enterica serovar Java TaxID=224729 RepID=A0A741LJQ7_SALEB|nr:MULTISPECIES: colicin release lysis protein [Enterobacteriaceae]EAA3705929.1 lysis protein for colicin E6 [Salmonella enterica subsp. enterica serovar Newport]EAB4416608.1 lysis protein for colicin E6 [Salmonella enterica]EAB6598888.1 lysis protein for colicin E6 [Salmonella enterica subsp. enterica serovar Chester]EBQ6076228.1 lysis protein for colicin E6 [Salmonella enterica subsp. enterica serovar Mississippi]EBS0167741.1 lysis protein for colicin E6 [Salmonella enterica subsp. enterica 
MKIVLSGSMTVLVILLLSGCQANYIRDVQGGTVAPSSSSELTGISVR